MRQAPRRLRARRTGRQGSRKAQEKGDIGKDGMEDQPTIGVGSDQRGRLQEGSDVECDAKIELATGAVDFEKNALGILNQSLGSDQWRFVKESRADYEREMERLATLWSASLANYIKKPGRDSIFNVSAGCLAASLRDVDSRFSRSIEERMEKLAKVAVDRGRSSTRWPTTSARGGRGNRILVFSSFQV